MTGSAVSKDNFTVTLSHELAETMSFGVTVQAPTGLPPALHGDHQVGDNEPDGGRYVYRLNGNLVQPYWSRHDDAFIVPDGNTQKFYLTPIWNNNTFTGKYDLLVQGDQFGAGYSDHISINRSPGNITDSFGVKVTMNNQTVAFDPPVINTVNVNTEGGKNFVEVLGVPAGVTLNVDSLSSIPSDDVVSIGSQGTSLAAIQGTVNVNNTTGQTQLQVDESHDGPLEVAFKDHPDASGFTDYSVAFSGFHWLATINYKGGHHTKPGLLSNGSLHGVTGLDVTDGLGQNQVDIESVPALTNVTLWADIQDSIWGPAAGHVNIHRNHM